MKRANKWIPKLLPWLPEDILNKYDIDDLPKQFLRACHALADIQEAFDLDPSDIANGIILDHNTKIKHIANSRLNSFDLINIAKEAKNVHFYEGSVKWLVSALKIAKEGNKSLKYIQDIR